MSEKKTKTKPQTVSSMGVNGGGGGGFLGANGLSSMTTAARASACGTTFIQPGSTGVTAAPRRSCVTEFAVATRDAGAKASAAANSVATRRSGREAGMAPSEGALWSAVIRAPSSRGHPSHGEA